MFAIYITYHGASSRNSVSSAVDNRGKRSKVLIYEKNNNNNNNVNKRKQHKFRSRNIYLFWICIYINIINLLAQMMYIY